MGLILLPKDYSTGFANPRFKPPDTVIDRKNKLAKGLKFYPVVIGNQVVDLVSGQIGVITGTGISFENTPEGLAVVSGGTSQVLFADIPHNIGSGPFTIITRFIWDGVGGSWQTAISLPNHNEMGIYLPRESTTLWMGSDTTSGGINSWSGAEVVSGVAGTYSISIADGSSTVVDGYKNGLFQTLTGSSDPLLSEDGTTGVNLFNGQGSEYAHGKMIYSMVYDRQLSAAEQFEIFARPYQVLKPRVSVSYFISSGSVDITGTLSETLDNVIMTASGQVGADVTGTLAETLDDSIMTASGQVGADVTGSLAETLDDAIMAATGQVGADVTGTLAETLDDTIMTALGTVGDVVIGTLSVTLDNSVMTATGQVGADVTGSLAETLDNMVMTATGQVGADVTGSLAETLDDMVMTATGEVGAGVVGTLSVTLDNTIMSASGLSGLPVTGTLAQTLADTIMTATGTSGQEVSGDNDVNFSTTLDLQDINFSTVFSLDDINLTGEL